MKIYLNKANESWIVDRFRDEWYQYNKIISTNRVKNSTIIWLIAPWTWQTISIKQLKEKYVICTIHHIDFEKFDEAEKNNFYNRDQYINEYHSISNTTTHELKKLTNKKITTIPFWINQSLFYEIQEKEELRRKYNIDSNSYVVGSFQRDTEGKDLKSPKLSKGPDVFFKIISEFFMKKNNLIVLLTGKRRNYLLEKLKGVGVEVKYFKMVDFNRLNELYNVLDLYIVASRVEGGPQAIFECALTKTPIVSTDVGIAKEILNQKSIFDIENFNNAEPDTNLAYKNSKKYIIPEGFTKFINLFEEIN